MTLAGLALIIVGAALIAVVAAAVLDDRATSHRPLTSGVAALLALGALLIYLGEAVRR